MFNQINNISYKFNLLVLSDFLKIFENIIYSNIYQYKMFWVNIKTKFKNTILE